MNPEIIRKEIAEVNSKIESYSAILDRLNLKKEKLIVFLYEEENLNFDHLTSLEQIVDSLNNQWSYTSLNRTVREHSLALSIDPRTTHALKETTPFLSTHNQTLKASNDHIISVADSIVSLLAEKQLWSFGVSYLAETLKQDKNIINQCLYLEAYSQFWRPHKNQQLGNSFSETWIADLNLINEKTHHPARRLGQNGQLTDTDAHLASPHGQLTDLRKPQVPCPHKKARKAFKRSLPPNSTNDLVEKATSVRDLLDRVFEANRGKNLSSKDILDYLYPDQRENWTKREQSFRIQIISRDLCTSIKVGNWRRVSTGLYTAAD
ncbi:MAG: hypothetical protein RLZZ171_1769 [Cyanobacteriota bacterium]|jgi:hypothetical protein